MQALFDTVFRLDFLISVIELSVPLVLAALAALVTNKAGVLNIGIEGAMLLAALFGAIAGTASGNFAVGLFAAVAVAVGMGVFMSFFVNKLKVNHILVGIAMNLLAMGLAVFIIYVRTGTKGDYPSVSVPALRIPFLSELPVFGRLLFSQNLMVYLAVAAVIAVAILMKKTRLGLHIRAVGEDALAAESVGIRTFRTKTTALAIGGVLAGLGGAFMSMAYMSAFNTGMIAGRGFIGIAAESMGAGVVGNTALAALLFGFVNTFAITAQVTLRIPYELLNTLPYLVTILALVLYAWRHNKRKRVDMK